MEPQTTPQPPTAPIPPTPQVKNSLVLIMSILLIVTVVIAGLFYFQIQKLSKELSKYQVQASPTPTITPNPTAGWKTFKNENYQYEVDYPNEWNTITSIQKGDKTEPIGLHGAELKGKVVDLHKNYPNDRIQPFLEISAWAESKKENFEIRKPSWKGEELIFRSNPAVKSIINFEGEPTANLQPGKAVNLLVYSDMNKMIYEIICNEDRLHEGFCDQILSTFKFLDQSNAEGRFCGGIAANLPKNQCPEGYQCKLDGDYPDASGVCTKN